MGKQRGKFGVVVLVVDDEAGIDRNRLSAVVDIDGMGVTAEAAFTLVNGDLMLFRQGPSG